jgi:hypothetical protein
MRRLALLAALLAATACNCGGDDEGGDTTPPAAPIVLAPANGATLDTTDLVGGQVVFSGTAEPGATVRIDGVAAGTAVAGSNGAWSIAATVAAGPHTVTARATDAAGNVSAPSAAVTFTLDTTRLAVPIPAGSPVPVSSWGQTMAAVSGPPEAFPGQANAWVLDLDFSLALSAGLQFQYALVLYTGTPTTPVTYASLRSDVFGDLLDPFLGDQRASEVQFLTPFFREADGVVTAAASNGAAYLNGTSDSRLSRTLTPTGGALTVGWTHQAVLLAGRLQGASAPPFGPSYRVVLRDPAGALVDTLFSSTVDVAPGPVSVTRTGLPAQVVLSFELRSAAEGIVQIDDVTVDGALLSNGDFAAGLDGWVSNDGAESQNVRSAPREATPGSALQITRTFYAPPAATWGRLVDVFENTGDTEVTTTAVYLTALGAPLLGGTPLAAVTQDGAAVVGWDATQGVRDVGIVFGTGTAFVDDAYGPTDPFEPFVFVAHELTVAAGEKVALVHFVVQLGEADGGLSALPEDVPAGTELECADVAAGFPALEAYRIDLEPGVLGLVRNF